VEKYLHLILHLHLNLHLHLVVEKYLLLVEKHLHLKDYS
jgi:hypothetical protein